MFELLFLHNYFVWLVYWPDYFTCILVFINKQIKATLGITGLFCLEALSAAKIGTSMLAHRILLVVEIDKGLCVHQLKRYVSWVQNVVKQFGPYLLCLLKFLVIKNDRTRGFNSEGQWWNLLFFEHYCSLAKS